MFLATAIEGLGVVVDRWLALRAGRRARARARRAHKTLSGAIGPASPAAGSSANPPKAPAAAIVDPLAAVAGKSPAAVVTGGSAGIGLAMVRLLARRGIPVLIVARDPDRNARAVGICAAESPSSPVAAIPLDVASPDAALAIEAALAARGWYLDILVNSAGIGLSGPFAEQREADLASLVALNVAAVTTLTRHALDQMVARARGGVINVSSLAGYVPGPHQAVYYASRAYVASLSSALHVELIGTGVRMTTVAPGPVDTRFHEEMGAERSLYLVVIPPISAERVAEAAWAGFRLARRVVVPGIVPRLVAGALWILPEGITLPFVSLLLRRP